LLLLRVSQILKEPHNGEAGNEIGKRKRFLNKVKYTPKRTFPTTESFVENERRNGGPNDIPKLTQKGDGVGSVANDIHKHAKYQ
jgi:hypothetical protein